MAQEEISSLLLKVAVDYQSLEQFAGAMPIVLDVAQAVGQQLDALQIGNPEVFAAKGQALSRALVAGFQAEALGLTFAGGQSIAGIITERVFGKLDPSSATAYVRDVQKILDNVRLQLPQVNQPLISAASLGSLSNVQSFAAGAKNELMALSSQLNKNLAQLSTLSQIAIPQTVIKKTPEGGLAFTPTAVKAIGAASTAGGFGQVPQAVTQAFGSPVLKGDGSVNVTQTNAAVQAAITAAVVAAKNALSNQQLDIKAQQQSIGAVTQAVGLSPHNLAAVATGTAAPPQAVTQALNAMPAWEKALLSGAATVQSSTTALSQAAQRAADALNKTANLPFPNQPAGITKDIFGDPVTRGAGGQYYSDAGLPIGPSMLGLPAADPNPAFLNQSALAAAAVAAAQAVQPTIQEQVNALAAASQGNAAFTNANLRPAIMDYQGGTTEPFQKGFDALMRGEDIFGTYAPGTRALLGGINASPEITGLTRGVRDRGYGAVPDYATQLLNEAKTFGELRLAFAGFTSDLQVSKGFATNTGKNPLLLEMVGAAKGLDFNKYNPNGGFDSEKEFLTSGRFAVESIRRGPIDPNQPIGHYNPEADIIRIRQLATEYNALEQRLAKPPPDPAAFNAFQNALRGQPLALGPGVGAGPASAVDRGRLDALFKAKQEKVFAQFDRLQALDMAGPGVLRSADPFGGLRIDPSRIAPSFPLGSGVPIPLPGANAAGGIPGAPQLTRGTQAIQAQRQELVALGQAADDTRSRVGSALAVGARGLPLMDPFGGAGGRGGGGGGRGGFPPPGPFGPFDVPGGFGGGPGAGPGGPSLFDRLKMGARQGIMGDSDDLAQSLARTAFSALKFSVAYGAAYGALRLFTGGFGAAVQNAIEFETALTDLNIATERSARSNERFAFSLSDLGAGRGITPGESVAAGARSVGLFDQVGAAREQQEAVARQSLDTAGKLAFISGQPIEGIQTQIAGISRSFNVDALDQERIADVAAYIGRRTGRPGGEILQSLGQIGSLGESAGFDLNQVAAIIARLTSTTGQTPQAVSGFLSQVLSRADDPRLREKLRGVGVQTEGTTLAQQIQELSAMDLPDNQRNQIIQAFGRGRSGQALGIILDQFPDIQRLAGGARTDSAGLADKDFQQAVNSVGGQLRTLGAAIKDLGAGLASLGALDPLVALLSVFKQVVDALDFVVDGFNLIPRELRTAGFALLEFYAILALLGRFTKFGKAAVAASAAAGSGALVGDLLDRDGNVVQSADEQNRRRKGRLGSAGAVGGALGASLATSAGGAFSALGGTAVGGAVGGALGFGALGAGIATAGIGIVVAGLATGIAKTISEAGNVDALLTTAGIKSNTARNLDELSSAESAADKALKAAEERDDFKLLSKDSLTLGIGNIIDSVTGGARDQKAEAKALQEANEARRKELEEIGEKDPFSVFGDFASVEGVSGGLAELSERGLTAARQLELLNGAFDALIDKSGEAGAAAIILGGQGEAFGDAVATATLESAATAAQTLAGSDPSKGIAGGVTDLLSSVFGVVASPVTGVAGGLGRVAGGDRRAGSPFRFVDFAKGFGDSAGEALQEGLPFLQSDREQAEENAENASEFARKLRDPKLREKLQAGVAESLAQEGLDPSQGPVSLTDQDVDVIKARQIQILEENLGKPLSDLPKDVREAYEQSIEDSIKIAVGDFGGVDINASNARAYLQSVRQLAGKAGQDLALTSGSEVEGAEATLDYFRQGRGKIEEGIGKLDADLARGDLSEEDRKSKEDDRQKLIDLLGQYDLDILNAIKGTSQAQSNQIKSLADLAKSNLLQGDVRGANAIDLASVNERLTLPNLGDNERRALEAERNNLLRKDAQDAMAIDAASALNELPVRAQGARVMVELGNAEAKLRTLAVGSLEYEQTVAQINQLQDTFNTYALDLAQAVGQLGINPNDAAAASRAALADANARLADAQATTDPLAIARAQRAQQLAAFQVNVTDPIGLQNARNRASANGTGLQDANISLVNAQNDLLGLVPGTREYFEKQAEISAAGRALAQEQAEGAKASRRASINPGDELANARADVLDARIDLGLTVRGSKEYYLALNALNRTQLELATQEREAARRTRRLGTDSTDSLTQARQDVIDARQRLEEARGQGGDTSKEQQDLEDAQARERAAAFDRTLGDARIANDLGQTSNAQYLQFLQGERERLAERIAGMKQTDEGYRQAVEQLQQLDQAIKAAGEQFSGQFNLGDIDIPTPFEVRRSIAQSTAQGERIDLPGPFKRDIYAPFDPNPTGGTTVSITVNGGDINEVKQVMAQYLGPIALSVAPTVTPTRI